MPFTFAFATDYNERELETDWRALEAAAAGSFFLSWTWIGAWLESNPVRPILVRVVSDGELAALGFFARHPAWRFGVVPVRQLLLHATGDADRDRIEVEYNGLLTRAGQEEVILPLVLRQLGEAEWDECVLPGIADSMLPAVRCAGLVCHVIRRSPCYAVALDSGRDLMERLSPNARSQLRRALHLAEEKGPLLLRPAETAEEAQTFLDRMKQLDRWAARGKEGAFATSARVGFHRSLIRRGWSTGAVEMLEARAGDSILGYLYQFAYRGRVMAYQAAYNPAPDNRHRPGLVMHWLAMERARAAGFRLYDFLAGDARYKRSLGRRENTLVWCRLQKPGLLCSTEMVLRRLRGRLP